MAKNIHKETDYGHFKICNLHNKTIIINEEPFYKERYLVSFIYI